MLNRQIGQIAAANMSYALPFHNHNIQMAPEPGVRRSSRDAPIPLLNAEIYGFEHYE
jgi:hypothetical protein